ncbi:MAG: hypothetical protein BGO43_04120 [Gammaproteobacteria bacterium 39-13]|nr:hypothetical protein [Gammaproteobacteria bacterium]OJV94876.1 MAG: hypothetical protein BGO43_04120 [Gammaproteobacteria bacterium 39-13]
MRYTEEARLGPNPTIDGSVTIDQFLERTVEERESYRGNLYCCSCNSKMSFIFGKRKSHFKHYPRTGINCKKTTYISQGKRAFLKVNQIIKNRKSFRIIGHMKGKKTLGLPPFCPPGVSGPPAPINSGTKITEHKVKKSKYDLHIEEILEQLLNGIDLTNKEFLFEGKYRKFTDLFINVHKISYGMQHSLTDNNTRIYWGKFYKICCKKGGEDCELRRLSPKERLEYPISVYCAISRKHEPCIDFSLNCNKHLIKDYQDLLEWRPKGCLSVISNQFKKHAVHPHILVNKVKNNVCYLQK